MFTRKTLLTTAALWLASGLYGVPEATAQWFRNNPDGTPDRGDQPPGNPNSGYKWRGPLNGDGTLPPAPAGQTDLIGATTASSSDS